MVVSAGIYGIDALDDAAPIDYPFVAVRCPLLCPAFLSNRLTNRAVFAMQAMVKGNSGNHFAVKAGNAQKSGSLQTLYDGPRPNKNYAPMRKQGAIILGIGGDNSPWAGGIFVSQLFNRTFIAILHRNEG